MCCLVTRPTITTPTACGSSGRDSEPKGSGFECQCLPSTYKCCKRCSNPLRAPYWQDSKGITTIYNVLSTTGMTSNHNVVQQKHIVKYKHLPRDDKYMNLNIQIITIKNKASPCHRCSITHGDAAFDLAAVGESLCRSPSEGTVTPCVFQRDRGESGPPWHFNTHALSSPQSRH